MTFLKSLFARPTEQERANRVAIDMALATGTPFFHDELMDFLKRDSEWVSQAFNEFASCLDAWRYLTPLRSPSRETDGVAKAVDVAEGFALWCVVKRFRPKVVVELGVNRGVSSRLWKEALKVYVPEHRLLLCDLEDQRQLIQENEAEFIQGDAFVTLDGIMEEIHVDLLFNDAHPYDLIEWSVKKGLDQQVSIFAFHDTGHHHPRGPYMLSSANLSREEKLANRLNWGEFGAWERHVIGEIFDPRALNQDSVDTDEWKIRHFDSFLGISLVVSKGEADNG